MSRSLGAAGEVASAPDDAPTRVALSVVIPAYNEQEILADTVAAIVAGLRAADALPSFEVVISENGSSDRTRLLGRELATRYDEVVVLESDTADYGAAMRDGFQAARGEVIVNFDADYYDLDFVQQALGVDADIVVAAKGIAGSTDTRTLLRRTVSRVFSLFVRRLLDLHVTETHGMKLFRRAAIEPLLPAVEATKDLFDTELLARAERRGLRIVELPIRTEEMRHSRSGIVRRIPRTVWGLVKMRYRLRRAQPATDRTTEATGRSVPGPARSRLEADPEAFGQRLLVVGGGGTVEDAEETVLALDATAAAVLVVTVPAVTADTGSQVADALDRIAMEDLADRAPAAETGGTDLAAVHAGFFGEPAPRPLNHDQHAVVVVRERPGTAAWEELIVELGRQLAGVYLLEGDEIVPLAVPEQLLRHERRPRPRVARVASALAVLAVVGLAAALALRTGDAPPATTIPAVVRNVAAPAPGGATHNWWIGQDHLARTSDGTLLAVYGNDQGLQIVADHANHGRSWQQPAVLPDVRATSSSVAIDDRDRLHVAFSDGTRVAYALVEQRADQWAATAVVELDPQMPTNYLDIAYDDAADVAHLVWAEEAKDGQAPRWAAVTTDAGQARVVATDRLAPPADAIPVLVNVAAGPGAQVVATYRRGDSPLGWFARGLAHDPSGTPAWGAEEQIPTEAGIGAADIVVDRAGTAHLVLRDSTGFELTYFTRRDGRWSQGETAVDADAIEEIDFPSLAVDRTSQLVYLFFQSDRAQPRTGIQVAVRDPASGWQQPFPAAPADAIPDGATLPAALSDTAGAPVVIWTAGGATPAVQAAVIVP